MVSHKNSFLIYLVIISVVAVSAIVFNMYREVKVVSGVGPSASSTIQNDQISIEENEVKNLAQSEQIAGWKTLNNKEVGVEIKIPTTYKLNTEFYSYEPLSLIIDPSEPAIEFSERLIVSRGKEKVGGGVSVDSLVNDIYLNNKNISLKDKTNIEKNGLKFLRVTYMDISGIGPEFEYISYYIIKNSYLYEIKYFLASDEANSTFENIIGTIRFFNPEPVVNAKTKTYKNATYGFSVEYPIEWENPTDSSTISEFKITFKNIKDPKEFVIKAYSPEHKYTLDKYINSWSFPHAPSDLYDNTAVDDVTGAFYDLVKPVDSRRETLWYTRTIDYGVITLNGSLLTITYGESEKYKTEKEAKDVDVSEIYAFLSNIKLLK